jgi:hypothetical protein
MDDLLRRRKWAKSPQERLFLRWIRNIRGGWNPR